MAELFSNGLLIEADSTPKQIADSISYMINLSDEERNKMRLSSRDKWQTRFNAEENAKRFVDSIKELCGSELRRIILITEGFPYGGESAFITSEIRELIRHFDIILIAEISARMVDRNSDKKDKTLSELLELVGGSSREHRIEVYHTDDAIRMGKYLKHSFGYFFDSRVAHEKQSTIKEPLSAKWQSVKYYAKAKAFAKWFEKAFGYGDYADTLIYTYWQLPPTLGMCLNKNHFNGVKIITRTHGADLYDERVEKSHRQPFRWEMDRVLDAVYFISEAGRDYYIKRNDVLDTDEKYRVSYLGSRTPDKADLSTKESFADDVFRLVSCSNVIAIKRIDRIIAALGIIATDNKLSKMKGHIEWIHFGSGHDRGCVEELATAFLGNNDRVAYRFMGKCDNDQIHDFYAHNKVDCFITTSSTEGLPVSIMEAMSYGIPIIATDVGGIREEFE